MIQSPPLNTIQSSNQPPSTNTAITKDPSTYQQNTDSSNSQSYTQGNPTNSYPNKEATINPDKLERKSNPLISILVSIIIILLIAGAGVFTYYSFLTNKIKNITSTIQTDNNSQEEGKGNSTLSSSKTDETNNVDTTTKPPLSYSIDYYDVDTAKNVSLITVSDIDSDKKKIIEESLAYMNTKTDFIEEYAFVIMDGSINRDASIPIGIMVDGKQVLIGTTSENADGVASAYNKYIVLDSSLESGELRAVLVHEIGHLVWDKLSPEQAKSYMGTRNMTTAMISSWYKYLTEVANGGQSSAPIGMDVWTKSPSEDFAEVFKQVFGGPQDGGNYWAIKTVYGTPSEQTTLWFKSETSAIFQKP